jgi:hypothetical protein
MVRELPRMVPHGHSAINRARAMFTCGPSEKFERIRHEGSSATSAAPAGRREIIKHHPLASPGRLV